MTGERTLTGLQFLRGICALAVVIDHTAGMAVLPKYFGRPFLGGALEHGAFGVDIFFVISAFIISIVVLGRKQPDEAPMVALWRNVMPVLSASTFFRKRFIRIVPLMWVSILSYAVLQYAFARSDIDAVAYFRALFLIPYSIVKPDMIWTLRHEFIFYMAFAFSFLGPAKLRLILPAFILSPIAYGLLRNGLTLPTSGINTSAATLFSAVNLEFGAGILVGLIWVRTSPPVDVHLPWHPLLTLSVLTTLVIASGAALPWLPQSVPCTALIGILGAALVALSARAICPPGNITAVGGLLGNASYAIYLFHLHTLASGLALWSKLLPGSSLAFVVPVMVLMATSVGIAVHLLIERPLVRWTRHRLSTRSTLVADRST